MRLFIRGVRLKRFSTYRVGGAKVHYSLKSRFLVFVLNWIFVKLEMFRIAWYLCSCGFTIRGSLSANQFLYVTNYVTLCWSLSFFEVVGCFFFFCMYWCRWEKRYFIYNAILLTTKSRSFSISDIHVVQLIQLFSFCLWHDSVNAAS